MSNNEVRLRGRIVAPDPYYKVSRRGRPMLILTLAMYRDGTRPKKFVRGREEPDYATLVILGEQATVLQDLQKGTVLDVSGYLQSRNIKSQDRRSVVLEVVAESVEVITSSEENSRKEREGNGEPGRSHRSS